jgi:hypothetical protein
MDAEQELSPQRIRGLRGGESRTTFAKRLGVTAQTVYRWELPSERTEARRPRGLDRARLEALARGKPPDAANAAIDVPREALRADDDLASVLPSLRRLMEGDARRGHAELIEVLALRRDLSTEARAAASFGVTLFEIIFRSDARAASLALAPALADAEAGKLSSDMAAKVFAAASLVHAWPDGVLFDIGRVHAYGVRAEALASDTDREASCTACIAAIGAAVLAGDQELLDRAYTRLEETRWHGLPPLLELHVHEFLSMKLAVSGRPASLRKTHEAIIEQAERVGCAPVLARSLGRLALSVLDALGDPAQVLALVERARRAVSSSRLAPGWHDLLLVRAEVEALLRLGRIPEALTSAEALHAFAEEARVPPLPALGPLTRLYQLTARTDALTALAEKLRTLEVASLKPIAHAYAAFIEGVALLVSSDDPEATLAAVERAERAATRWPLLLREVLFLRVTADIVAGDLAAARTSLRRAQRVVDAMPSGSFTAQLRRLEGGLLVALGQWTEGSALLESALATFELARDRCDAAVSRYLLTALSDVCNTPDPEAVDAARADVEALGLVPPRTLEVAVARSKLSRIPVDERIARADGAGPVLEDLVVPLQRLAVRGAAPELVLRELRSLLDGLLPGREVTLEELDSAGTRLGQPRAAAGHESSEFSDGAGRLFRVVAEGALTSEERAIVGILTTVAALALEAAVLRGFGEAAETIAETRTPELPEFVVASPRMRKLRAELVAIASSPATVIVTGESGAGKEVVARAVHALSPRAEGPFVAFNCSAVPRDLFEGQLFGYRRGAFTGATSDQQGVIRAAAGGTLFLDEIGELPLDVQPKLLRLLENSEVFPLGERRPVRVDVRVVAATHRDLPELVRQGKLREDLYYRLQVLPVSVPPLRERREDIPVLARHFVRALSTRGEPPVLAADAISLLVAQRWPGNVRELRNVIERTLALAADKPVLRARDLRLAVT